MAVCGIHVKALAIQFNMFRDCYGSHVNMATTDIVVFSHLSKSPTKSQISIWLLSSESKKDDALSFKLNYIMLHAYAFKNQGDKLKNSKLPVTKSHNLSRLDLKEHGNNLLANISTSYALVC